MFHEPVTTILRRLKAQGILVESHDPRARIRRNRDDSDLRVLCLEFGLAPTGTADHLVDRLLTIDPSGLLLGYAGELLQCSKAAAAHLLTPNPAHKTDTTWEMLTARAERTARDGNLALCRDVYLWMANHLVRRHAKIQALQALCVVCVFDLCGARNRSELPEQLHNTESRFDAALASLDPCLVQRVRTLSRELGLSIEGIREIFLRVCRRLELPKHSQKLWVVFQLALGGALETVDADSSRVIRRLLA